MHLSLGAHAVMFLENNLVIVSFTPEIHGIATACAQ